MSSPGDGESLKSAIEEQFSQLGFNDLSKEDPTEVFELLEMIGTGAYGSVFMARESQTDQLFAIKFLELEKSKGNDVDVIVNEINIMKESIECPYIVEYCGCYTKDEVIMVVMEYCACSVEDILSFCDDYTFTEPQIAAVCAAVVKGLAYLHAYGISHRDIKSGNVLLKETGEVKLADFGVSHKLAHERDKMKTLAGSPYWCAPELITADSYDNKVDIWACGIVALEMAEGRPPHWDMEPLQVIFHIPKQPPPKLKEPKKWSADFSDFLEKCLKKDPDQRATAVQLLCHPFILSGSSREILAPMVGECLPILLPKKQREMEEEEAEQEDEGNNIKRGTMLTVDKSTLRAKDFGTTGGAPQKERTTTVTKKRTSTLRGNRAVVASKKKMPFFGVPLEQSITQCEIHGMKHVTEIVMSHMIVNCLDTEGLFRVSGEKQKIDELKDKFDDGIVPNLSQYQAHELAGLLKLYFRELPEPLLTFKFFREFVDAQRLDTLEQRCQRTSQLVNQLPVDSKKLLYKLIIFLAIVASHQEKNMMNSSNLARCIGPNLLHPKEDISPTDLMRDASHINSCVQLMIENHDDIF